MPQTKINWQKFRNSLFFAVGALVSSATFAQETELSTASNGDPATEAEKSRSSVFDFDPLHKLELLADDRTPVVLEGTSAIAQSLRGDKTSQCTPYGRRSFSRGEAFSRLIRQSRYEIKIQLRTKAFSQGGHYRTCGACLGNACVPIHGNDTESSAQTSVQSTVSFNIPSEFDKKPIFLNLEGNNTSGVIHSVRDSNAQPIQPIEGSVGRYVIEDRAGATYFVVTELSANTESGGGCCEDREEASVIFEISIEPGPLLYTTKFKPYIRGGSDTNGYRQVGAITLHGVPHCTGTLIGSKSVLTAAHCVAGYDDQIRHGVVSFVTGSDASNPDGIYLVKRGVYPNDPASGFDYNAISYDDDIAILYLGKSVDLAPIPLHSGSPDWDSMKQFPLWFVGFGYNVIQGGKVGFGVKREATWKIDTLDSNGRKISWRNANTSTCDGDSGGPALKIDSTTMTVVAVTSGGFDTNEGICTAGINTRVDAYLPWLNGKVR